MLKLEDHSEKIECLEVVHVLFIYTIFIHFLTDS